MRDKSYLLLEKRLKFWGSLIQNGGKMRQGQLKRCAITYPVLGCLIMLLASCATNKTQQMAKFSNDLCQSLIQAEPNQDIYHKVFSESFKESLNQQQFTQMTNSIVTQYGQCQEVSERTDQGILTLLTDRGNHLSFEMRLNNEGDKLQGLFFHGMKNDLNRFRDKAQWVCNELFKPNPTFNYKNHFTEAFQKAIPYEKLVAISADLHEKFGKCDNIEIPKNALLKEFYAHQKNGKKLIFSLVVEEDKDKNLIAGLLFKGEKTEIIDFKSAQEILKELQTFDGLMSALIIKEGDKVLDFKASETHALGSVFKLYVLAALSEKIKNGKLTWDSKFPIKNKDKSLPSGVMQNYPEGREVTLKEYAAKMISISDNTATDHLIEIVGRKEIEDFITREGLISNKSYYVPFLKTKEMFAARAAFKKEDYTKYANANRKERLAMLKKADKGPQKIMNSLKNWDKPRNIADLEWYATPQEVCRLKFWLNKSPDHTIKETLAINAPFAQENNSYLYSGYKGGSEPGVLEMAYLLKKNDKSWSCFYLGQNNAKANINHSRFFQIAQSILKWYSLK